MANGAQIAVNRGNTGKSTAPRRADYAKRSQCPGKQEDANCILEKGLRKNHVPCASGKQSQLARPGSERGNTSGAALMRDAKVRPDVASRARPLRGIRAPLGVGEPCHGLASFIRPSPGSVGRCCFDGEGAPEAPLASELTCAVRTCSTCGPYPHEMSSHTRLTPRTFLLSPSYGIVYDLPKKGN
jgi:hypothetical protein